VAAAIYLAITTVSTLLLAWLGRHYAAGVRKAEL
jgi:histidine transport system permease protein